MDSPPTLDSTHGEILRRALTPNTAEQIARNRAKGKGRERVAGRERVIERGKPLGLGIRHQASPPMEFSYLPDRFDEFGPLPTKPLVFTSPKALPLHRPQAWKEQLDSTDSIPKAKPKNKPKPPISTLENLGIIHPSPDPSSSPSEPTRPFLPQTKTPSSSSKQKNNLITQTPETLAISQRLVYLRKTASARDQPPDIFRAILTNNTKLLTNLLNSGQAIESAHPTTDTTPIILAASLGNFEILELLLDRNANTAAIDNLGRSALHYAASENFPECTELLLAYGASPDIEDQEKETPLHRAVRYLRLETVEILLGWTKNPLKHRNARGQTALHLAARNRGVDIIESICERAKKIEHVPACLRESELDPKSPSSVHNSCNCSCPIIYQGVDIEDDSGDTALQTALLRRSMEAVSQLLKYTTNGANSPQRMRYWSNSRLESEIRGEWERPLHYAVRGSSKTLVKRLLDGGADATLLNWEGKTALAVAVEKENWAGIRSLLNQEVLLGSLVSEVLGISQVEFEHVFAGDEKLDFDVRTSSIWYDLLVEACRRGKWEKVCWLVKKARDKKEIGIILDKENAIEMVIEGCEEGRRAEVVDLLLSLGGANGRVKVHKKDGYWEYPIHLATAKNDIPLVEILLRHGASLEDLNSQCMIPFHTAILKSNITALNYFLTNSTAPLSTTNLTTSPKFIEEVILLACTTGSISKISLLLSTQPHPHPSSSPHSHSHPRPSIPAEALHTAVYSGNLDVVKWLLEEKGCDPLALNKNGKTAAQARYVGDDEGAFGEKCRALGFGKGTRGDWERCRTLVLEAGERKRRMERVVGVEERVVVPVEEGRGVAGVSVGV